MSIIVNDAYADVVEIIRDLVPELRSSGARLIEDTVVFVGDSLTSASSIQTRVPNLQGLTTLVNDGNGGDTVADLVARADVTDAYFPNNAKGRLFVLIGTNNLLDTSSDTGVSVHEELKAYCKARKSKGWKISVATLPQQDGIVNASEVLAYNALIQANWDDYADELIDLARDPRLQDSTDTIYFNADEVHLTTLGYDILGYHYNAPYASPTDNAYTLAQHFGGDIEVTSVEGKANNSTRIEFSSNYSDYYANTTNIMRVGNGSLSVNPFGSASADFIVYADSGTSPILNIDVSANSGTGLISMGTLPTTDPAVAGALWNDAGVLKVSAG